MVCDTQLKVMRVKTKMREFLKRWEDELWYYGRFNAADSMDMIKELSEKILAFYGI